MAFTEIQWTWRRMPQSDGTFQIIRGYTFNPWWGCFKVSEVGTSVGLQARAVERVLLLLEIPVVVRFLSCEPLLGPLDLSPWISQLQWVISGGESGAGARVIDMAWLRLLRDQCQATHVPYFFKQVGGRYHSSGGRELDGRTWDEIPPEIPSPALSLLMYRSDAEVAR